MLKSAAYLGIFILIAHFLGIYYSLYIILGWYDIPMHMLGGLWAGLMLAHFFGKKLGFIDLKQNAWITFFFVLGTATVVGVFWEFWEFFFSQLAYLIMPAFSKGNMELGDTLKDILDDMVGGSAAGLLAYYWPSSGK